MMLSRGPWRTGNQWVLTLQECEWCKRCRSAQRLFLLGRPAGGVLLPAVTVGRLLSPVAAANGGNRTLARLDYQPF